MKVPIILVLIFILALTSEAQQNVGINNDGSAPDPKAILDVKSNDKGILIPRISTLAREAILNPPAGLMVYDTDIKSFFYHTGVNGIWKNMLANLELPYFEGVSLNSAAFSIQNAEPSPTAIAGQFTSAEGISIDGLSGGIGGRFWGATSGIDVTGGLYAGKFYGGNGLGVYVDMNGWNLNALVVDRGRTGLGTTTPSAKLHVRDANASNGNNNGEAIFKASAFQPSIPDEMNLEYWIAQPAGGQPSFPYFGMRTNHRLNLVSNNNTSNPEISLFNNKVGINKQDGIYPLSINGKTAFYEDNNYAGELFGSPNGNLLLNAKSDETFENNKNLILQGETNSKYVGIHTNSPTAFLDVQKTGFDGELVAKIGASLFDFGTTNITNIEGGVSKNNGYLSLNRNSDANVSICEGQGDVIIAAGGGSIKLACKPIGGGDVFIASYPNGTNGGNVFIAQSGGDVIMKHDSTSLSLGTDKKDHRLNVNGTIRSTELIVEAGWADYVFDSSYDLKPLTDVEKYISEHRHLPEIPSAADIQANGLKVSEIQTKMIAKIEELTLYLIDQNKRIEAMAKEIEFLKSNK